MSLSNSHQISSQEGLQDKHSCPNTSILEEDKKWMKKALELAKKANQAVFPNPFVGCVIVKEGSIISEGYHQKLGDNHAERNAILSIGIENIPEGSTCYVTLEPCSHHGKTPPCADLITQTKISRCVVAIGDPNPLVNSKGIERLKIHGIEVVENLLSHDAYWINRGFFHRIQHKKPWVTLKTALSLDGKIALANKKSQWISSSESRSDVQKIRSLNQVILTGIGTLLHDNPRLNVREFPIDKQPIRAVIDKDLDIPLDTHFVDDSSSSTDIIVRDDLPLLLQSNPEKNKKYEILQQKSHIRILPMPLKEKYIDIDALLQFYAQENILYVLVEAGGALSGYLLKNNLVNELIVYYAPKILGSGSLDPFKLPHFEEVPENSWVFEEVKLIGEDIKATLYHKDNNFVHLYPKAQ